MRDGGNDGDRPKNGGTLCVNNATECQPHGNVSAQGALLTLARFGLLQFNAHGSPCRQQNTHYNKTVASVCLAGFLAIVIVIDCVRNFRSIVPAHDRQCPSVPSLWLFLRIHVIADT